MNKKHILWIFLDIIFLIVFNMIFFVLKGNNQPSSVWISYGFIHFAYLMLLVTPFLIRETDNTAILGFPIYLISSVYFILIFILGLFIIFFQPETYKSCLIINIIITGLFAIMLLSHMIANESTADSIERHKVEIQYVKTASGKIKGIMETINNKQLLREVEKLYDLVHSSPLKSNISVRNYELEVLELINKLDKTAKNNNFSDAEIIISEIEKNMSERNRRLKYI